jgi:hypothetical protein
MNREVDMSILRNILVGGLGSLVLCAGAACSSDESTGGGAGGQDAGGGAAGTGGTSGGGGGTGGSGNTGNTGGTGNTSGTGGTSGAGGSTTDAGGKVTFSGSVVGARPGGIGSEDPLAGVEACVVDDNGDKISDALCDTTDANGDFAIEVDPNQQFMMTFVLDGYATQAIAVDIQDADVERNAAVRLPAAAGDGGGGGGYGWDPSVTQDSAKGLVNAVAVQPPADADAGGFDFTYGASFTITPSTGVAGPDYMDADEKWVSGATSTQGGYGAWFRNVEPGVVTIAVSYPGYSCIPVGNQGFGWPQSDGTSQTRIFAGINTQSIVFFCTPDGDAGAPDAGGADASTDAATD